jgi:NADPH:quinone reductase-like Zn-dependent oxidoreductase
MNAIVYKQYGSPDIVRLAVVPKPIPRDYDVLVEVHAASVVYSDLAFVKGKPFLVRLIGSGLLRPKYNIPGVNIAGQVEKTGSSVKRFRPGDEVFGDLSLCGRGGFAEYVRAPEDSLAPKPTNLTFEQAAAVPQAAVVALQGLRKGNIQAGKKVLVIGASGGIGSFAVQIAKSFAAEVTGVCSTRNLELVRSLGADYVIDYTKDDFAKNGKGYDLILATAGYRSIFDYRRSLAPGGAYVMTGGATAQVFQAMLGPFFSTRGKKMTNLAMKPAIDDLIFVKELIEAGKVFPVVDRLYPLGEVAKALKYYGEKHARGIVAISVKQDG